MFSKLMLGACGVICAVGLVAWMAVSVTAGRFVEKTADVQKTDVADSRATAVPVDAVTDEYTQPPADVAESLDRVRTLAAGLTPAETGMHVCFAEDTPQEVIDAFCEENPELCGQVAPGAPRFQFSNRWPGTLGTPRTLTWSLVPDGVAITSVSGNPGSDLFARMDSQFSNNGGRAVWIGLIESCFNRWSQLSGVTYTRITSGGNDWDDGAAWGTSGGSGRGDIRIAMVTLDGPSNVLAFNSFPGSGVGGDMVLDRSESWDVTTNNFRFMRDIIMHEHGHGLGFEHVCPLISGVNGRLMEPIINTSIDGPQHDDIRAVQFAYGDAFEDNDTVGAATDLGSVSIGQTLTPGTVPAPTPTAASSLTSIDNNGDQDYFKFTTSEPTSISASVTPLGFSYDSSVQACGVNGSTCCSGNIINSLTIADLNFQIISTNGSTVLATASSQPAGSPETLTNVVLASPGTYYIRVFEGNTPSESQLYRLSMTIQTSSVNQAVISLPNGPPATLTPGQPTTFQVQIDPNDATITPGTEVLVYSFGGGTMSSPLVSIGGNLYEATLPAAVCSDTPSFFISIFTEVANTSGFVRLPSSAPTDSFRPVVSTGLTSIFSDNGNTNMGWTVSGNASAGTWNRGAPLGGGDRGDPATDADGSGQCWLTNNGDGDTDVDGGTTTLTSPVFDLSAGGVISYDYWFNDLAGGNFDGDTFVVEVANDAGGTNWTAVRTYTTASGQWRNDSITIGSEIASSSTIRVRFSVSDLNSGTIVEGGLDAIEVSSTECQDLMVAPDAPTGVTASSGAFCDHVQVSWAASANADDYDLYRNTVDDSGSATMIEGGIVGTTTDDMTATPGTTYFYWVTACNGMGCSGFSSPSATGSVAPTLGPVTSVAATDTSCDAVQVSWSALPGADSYEVYRNTVDDGGTATSLGSTAMTSFNDNTATPDVTYYYFVQASNTCGAGALSASDAGTASGDGVAPANFTASDNLCDRVSLNWDAVPDGVFYEVFRNTTNDFGTASLQVLVLSPGTNDTFAVANVNYFYWVRTTNACGTGTPTVATPGIRLGALATAPVNVAASDDQCGMVRVTWDALAGASSYEVFRNTVDDAGSAAFLGTTSATMFDDTTAAASVTYYYFVSASNDCGDGPLSASDSGVTSAGASAPQNVSASNDACGLIEVTWDAVGGATEYEVFRNTVDDGGTAISLGTTASTSFQDATVVDGTTYFYFVSASTECGNTGSSASASGETAMLGDFNLDGNVDGGDIQGYLDAALGSYDSCADFTAPFGVIDADDTVAFASLLLGM